MAQRVEFSLNFVIGFYFDNLHARYQVYIFADFLNKRFSYLEIALHKTHTALGTALGTLGILFKRNRIQKM